MKHAWLIVALGGCAAAPPAPAAPVSDGATGAENVVVAATPRSEQIAALRAGHDAIDVEDPQWRPQVNVLAALPLDEPDLSALRDLCVSGFRAFIDAEDLHTAARATLLAAPDPIPEGDAQQIETMLGHSDAAIDRAQALLAQCREQLDALGG